jgi:hypothetical protein
VFNTNDKSISRLSLFVGNPIDAGLPGVSRKQVNKAYFAMGTLEQSQKISGKKGTCKLRKQWKMMKSI